MWLAIDGDCCYLRAQGAETQELTTRIILPRIAFTLGAPEPRAFRFQRSVSDERNGRGAAVA